MVVDADRRDEIETLIRKRQTSRSLLQTRLDPVGLANHLSGRIAPRHAGEMAAPVAEQLTLSAADIEPGKLAWENRAPCEEFSDEHPLAIMIKGVIPGETV